jgi:predicted transposase YbfD/YdcC
MAAPALYDLLASLPDPRSRHGRRHPLPALMGLLTLGLLLGCKSLEAIAQLGRDYGPALAHALGFRRKTPSKSTLSRFARRLDPQAVENALSCWIGGRLAAAAVAAPGGATAARDPAAPGRRPTAADVTSLDGKTLRGSREGELPGQHLVAAYAPHAEAVLAQIKVDAKTNEHKAALQLLGILPLAGKVVIGDALFCQRDVAARIVDGGGAYLFTVKGNQPGLETDIAAGFAFEAAARQVAAAFSPGAAAAAARAECANGGQGARPRGEAPPADDDAADVAAEMAGVGAGL